MMIAIVNQCPWCGEDYDIRVPYKGYQEWENGKLIQKALPTLSTTERECLITGCCVKCQDKIKKSFLRVDKM